MPIDHLRLEFNKRLFRQLMPTLIEKAEHSCNIIITPSFQLIEYQYTQTLFNEDGLLSLNYKIILRSYLCIAIDNINEVFFNDRIQKQKMENNLPKVAQQQKKNSYQMLRFNLYEQNKQQMNLYRQNNKTYRQSINKQKQSAHLNLKYTLVLPADPHLQGFQTHNNLEYFLPFQQQVHLYNTIDTLFAVYNHKGPLNRNRVMQDCLKLLNFPENQLENMIILQYLREKYICPLDLIQRIQICSEFWREGTLMMQTLMLIFCRHINPSVFLESILSVGKYITKEYQEELKNDRLKLKQFYDGNFCKCCLLYCCIRHKNLQIKDKLKNKNNKGFFRIRQQHEITSYFHLLAEFRQIISNNFILQSLPLCSLDCYRLMNKALFLHKYSSFELPSFEVVQQINMARLMYGNRPCLISSLLKISCAYLSVYLLLANKPDSLKQHLGFSQKEYLQQLHKEQTQNDIISCSCKKGQCRTMVCPCFNKNRQCDPQKCNRCFTISTTIHEACKNKSVIIGRMPYLKIGQSLYKQNTLGLFTLESIPSGTTICWTSGQIISQQEKTIRKLLSNQRMFIEQNRRKRDDLDIPSFKGKYKFIQKGTLSDANIQAFDREAFSQRYTCFEAVRDIESDEEIIRAY